MAMVSSSSPNPDSDNETNNTDGNPNQIVSLNPPGFPFFCLKQFAADCATGAAMGSIFGYGAGLFKKKGFKGSFADAGSSAKAFAAFSGVQGLVLCLLKRIRGKEDVYNVGIAGCCTGLAMSFPGTPQSLLQNCVTFGGFTVMFDLLNKRQTALAHTPSSSNIGPSNVLPPFMLPLPDNLKEGFSTFFQSLSKAKQGPRRSSY